MNPTAENNSSSPPPPPFDPKQPSVPISYPIKTLDDLESRTYFDSFHYPFNIAKVKLQSNNTHAGDAPLPDRRRMLVCHDMAGGYIDDKWIQGGNNPEAYAIWHWYLMDVFVYFSHNLVTLPPPCWTNTAHKHGVKVLGTFIMEWDEGAVLANKLLSTVESAQMYAERLAELALALGFDGWLINMEVEVKQVSNLKEFVNHLTKTIHSSIPGSLIIWYDSVTIDGKLDWQNQLNSSNKPFFDVCDGIFVNYTWKEHYPKLSAKVAGDRKFDVYMGIDVFGRNTFGGGKWNTNVALDVIKENDVSAAIFAPGWVYETHEKQEFQALQNRWWGLIEKSWGIVQKYPLVLPFFSNFDQGRGYDFYFKGEQWTDDYPYNNISAQSFQPLLEYSEDAVIQYYVDHKAPSYSGGGNLTFKGTLGYENIFTARLFEGEVMFDHSPIYVSYSGIKNGSSLVGLVLHFFNSKNEEKTVFLPSLGNSLVAAVGEQYSVLLMNRLSNKFTRIINPRRHIQETDTSWIIREFSVDMEGHVLTKINAVCYECEVIKPETRKKHMALADSTKYYQVLEQIRARNLKFDTLLGHISITTTTVDDLKIVPPANSWDVKGEYIEWRTEGVNKYLNVKLTWGFKNGNNDLFLRYIIRVKRLYLDENDPDEVKDDDFAYFLAVAETEAYYVSNYKVIPDTWGFKFIIQVCHLDGVYQQEDESPFLLLKVEDSV